MGYDGQGFSGRMPLLPKFTSLSGSELQAPVRLCPGWVMGEGGARNFAQRSSFLSGPRRLLLFKKTKYVREVDLRKEFLKGKNLHSRKGVLLRRILGLVSRFLVVLAL